MKTLSRNIGIGTDLACTLKSMDLKNRIDFGIYKSGPNEERKHFTKQSNKDLPLTFENADFSAEEPDAEDYWEEYVNTIDVGITPVSHALVKMFKFTPASEHRSVGVPPMAMYSQRFSTGLWPRLADGSTGARG